MTPKPLGQDPVAEARRHWEEHGWGDAAAGMAAVTAVMRTSQILLTRVEGVLKPFGLSFSRFELLALLSFTATGALPMAKAGARLQVHPTSVTNAVDRLEQAGLAARRPHPSDGRTVLVEITPAGRELVPLAASALNEEVFSRTGFDQEDLTALIGILTRFRRRAGDFDE
ncbi:MarR family transcriptional regulator [Arthrobacter sp. APC 3897]|uniref:MarR family winged helix-turn-helix transcriptional regulator n=1 Tax=Arthrobacter sp. APC 3897 TaxID=3035204 RepID=UPI0025B4AA60|nr:MarR family transcriptional regulator [Arthrobacter sp. APC 3897]MDN3480365.1 MarR family transcriptional regulator [Arthrobacter sp. APC 3897]